MHVISAQEDLTKEQLQERVNYLYGELELYIKHLEYAFSIINDKNIEIQKLKNGNNK